MNYMMDKINLLENKDAIIEGAEAVSYTRLTLPTIYSVYGRKTLRTLYYVYDIYQRWRCDSNKK